MLTRLFVFILVFLGSCAHSQAAERIPMPKALSRAKYDSRINPQFNPSINPKVNASLNPQINPHINPQRNTHISPVFNPSLDPLVTASLNPNLEVSLDPKKAGKFSGLSRFTPDGVLAGYIVRTPNPAVLLLFDQEMTWVAYAVDNRQQGYNTFDLNGNWAGYILKNAAKGFNEFDLRGEWTGFIIQ